MRNRVVAGCAFTDVVVYRCNSVKEEVLFRFRNRLRQLQAVSLHEICSFILVSVYIPLQAHMSSALQKLAELITDIKQKPLDSVLIILGDFNKANLSRELQKYRQHITCPTRDSNTLDHCYTAIKDAYHSVPRAALGLSDHYLVHLIPTYRQKFKSAEPVLRTVKRWIIDAEQDLKLVVTSLIGLFLRLLETTWTSSQRLQHLISVYVRICAFLPGLN